MSHENGIARCPHCRRMVRTNDNRYGLHSRTTDGSNDRCPISHQRTPVSGVGATEYVSRAHLVAQLAVQIHDEDPGVVWDYITAIPESELCRMLMVALAGVPVDLSVADIFSWVSELPAGRVSA